MELTEDIVRGIAPNPQDGGAWNYSGSIESYESQVSQPESIVELSYDHVDTDGLLNVFMQEHSDEAVVLLTQPLDRGFFDIDSEIIEESGFLHDLAWAYGSLEREHGSEYTNGPSSLTEIEAASVPYDFEEEAVEQMYESFDRVSREAEDIHDSQIDSLEDFRAYISDGAFLPRTEGRNLGDRLTRLPWEYPNWQS